MSKAPAFLLYAADFYMDTNTWTIDEIGIYTRLLFSEWVNGPLPNDETRLARAAGCSVKRFRHGWSQVQLKFSVSEDNKLFNDRLEIVRSEQKEYKEKQSLKGKKSAEKRWGDKVTTVITNASPEGNSSSSLSSSNKELKKPDGPFQVPSKEEITESSELKISDEIEKIAKQLYDEKIFPKVHAFKNTCKKQKKNPRSVLHTLCRCYVKRPDDPWAWCADIIKLEHLNYNERDHTKDSR